MLQIHRNNKISEAESLGGDSSGVTSGGSQSHSKGERGGREEASCRAWTQKRKGIDSLLLEPGQPLPPLIEWDDIATTEGLEEKCSIFRAMLHLGVLKQMPMPGGSVMWK